jgi:hypothetical protein
MRAYCETVDQEIPAAEVTVCPLCGTDLELSDDAGPSVVAAEEWAAGDLLPALAVMSCPNPDCPAKEADPGPAQ